MTVGCNDFPEKFSPWGKAMRLRAVKARMIQIKRHIMYSVLTVRRNRAGAASRLFRSRMIQKTFIPKSLQLIFKMAN
jgi:hypothetical protein